jgi:cysteinyl-tRNA synthetase
MSTTVPQRSVSKPAQPVASIRLYSTLSRKKEPLVTVKPGHVGIYLCGPTVYDKAHIGHMVGPVIFDTIKRYLVYSGYDVTWVVNITDVDDKLINKSSERGISMAELAKEMTQDYLSNLAGMGVDQIDHMPKATECMGEIIEFTQALIDRGYAYASDGDVFFDVAKDAEYGKLTNRSIDAVQGEGGEAAARKRNAADFALWKSAKPGEPSWDSPWGPGRPGWHIECSAMSRGILGETFDIHGGGLDLVFPHHENEIAQSECCHGKPMAKYWMHNGLLRKSAEAGKIGGRGDRAEGAPDAEAAKTEKMSRSKGAGGLADLIAKQGGERIRFFLLRTHYRSTVLFGEEAIAEAAVGLDSFYRLFKRLERITGGSFYTLEAVDRAQGNARFATQLLCPPANSLMDAAKQNRERFLAAMDDDFNTGGAVAELFELARHINKFIDENKLETEPDNDADLRTAVVEAFSVLRELSATLGLFVADRSQAAGGTDQSLASLVETAIRMRADARKRKDFAAADKIRKSLMATGITIEDRAGGTEWTAASDATAEKVREALVAEGIAIQS